MKLHFPEGKDVLLRHCQTRMEKHGEDDKPAIDLAIGVTGPNSLLDMIHPDLRAILFKPVGDDVPSGELDLPVDDRPSVRMPALSPPFKYDREHIGMTLKVSYGATGKADMVLGAVRLHKVRVAEVIEGGSCALQFTLSTTDVSEKIIGKLSLLQGHEIHITLTFAEAEDEPTKKVDSFLDEDKVAAQAQQQPTAEDIFTGSGQ